MNTTTTFLLLKATSQKNIFKVAFEKKMDMNNKIRSTVFESLLPEGKKTKWFLAVVLELDRGIYNAVCA